MKQTVSFITLGVADLVRSRLFYTTLGWKESSASQAEIAFFNAGTVVFGLFQRAALAEDANVPATGSGFPGFTLAHNVDSEDAVIRTLAEAVAAGATLTRPAEKVFWGGFRGYFADPDGFLWEVCFNPFFPLDAQGHVQLPA
jgi:catechol 2,3-dioxygenase-like lactoylglutathione lyase family enzyme